jgi:regulator of protease activity HflC (stomatin/prohibitin superfamily)
MYACMFHNNFLLGQVLTRDSVTVAVDAVVYYRIKEPLNAVVKVADYRYPNNA